MILSLRLLTIIILILSRLQALPMSPSPSTVGKSLNWNRGRGYNPFRYATPDGITICNRSDSIVYDCIPLNRPTSELSITFRASNRAFHPSKKATYTSTDRRKHTAKNPAWSFMLISTDNDTLSITVRAIEQSDQISSSSGLCVEAVFFDKAVKITTCPPSKKFDCYTGTNFWHLSIKNKTITLSGGNRDENMVFECPYKSKDCSSFGFAAYPGADITLTDISFFDLTPQSYEPHPNWSDTAMIEERINASDDPLEGYWMVFDRTLDESLLRLGGDYRLAIVKDNGRYLLIYLSGAKINPTFWKTGMVKAILNPDPYPDTYSVMWYDSEGMPLNKDIKAQRGEGDTLLLQFPYQSSTLRLRKPISSR